jgi:hypothetical protein
VHVQRKGIELLEDVHRGVCGPHSYWRLIIGKVFRHEFYWPTAKDDAIEVINKCRDCQFYQKQTTKHANPLQLIDVSNPFTVRGIDIVGVLPRAPGGFRYLFVRVDTFTKWMKVMPAVNIT